MIEPLYVRWYAWGEELGAVVFLGSQSDVQYVCVVRGSQGKEVRVTDLVVVLCWYVIRSHWIVIGSNGASSTRSGLLYMRSWVGWIEVGAVSGSSV